MSAYDPHPVRQVLPCNTKRVDGLYLEDIPETSPGIAMGVALICRDWNDICFMQKRDGYSDDEYFQMADTLLQRKGIKRP